MDREPDDEVDPLHSLEKLDRFLDGEEQTTLYFELEKMGGAPPLNPEAMADPEIARALTDLIWGLWDLGVVVEYTDHLSDRELYLALLQHCDEPTVVFPEDPDMWCHWSPIGGCTDEEMMIELRYYGDEEYRKRWAEEYGTYDTLPPSELPPYYRSWLPQRSHITQA